MFSGGYNVQPAASQRVTDESRGCCHSESKEKKRERERKADGFGLYVYWNVRGRLGWLNLVIHTPWADKSIDSVSYSYPLSMELVTLMKKQLEWHTQSLLWCQSNRNGKEANRVGIYVRLGSVFTLVGFVFYSFLIRFSQMRRNDVLIRQRVRENTNPWLNVSPVLRGDICHHQRVDGQTHWWNLESYKSGPLKKASRGSSIWLYVYRKRR